MRIKVLTAILTLVILLAPALIAQADKVKLSEENPTIYTVVKGDTLWDISGKFFDDPFRWPKLWKWNAYIHNPHLIYPGDVLKITPTGIERVTERDLSDLQTIRLVKLGNVERETPTKTPSPRVAVFSSPNLKKRGFITKDELKMSAAIAASADTGLLLMHANEEVFISYKDQSQLSPGQTYTLFVITNDLTHPETDKFIGHITEDIGSIVVKGPAISGDSKKTDVFVGTIDKSYREISPGTLLKPYKATPTELEIVAASSSLKGYVLAGLEGLNQYTENSLIFIDKGKKDGLKVGNLLQIYRERPTTKDPLDESRELRLPADDLGVMIITDVRGSTSHGLIIKSNKVVHRGDRVRAMGPLN